MAVTKIYTILSIGLDGYGSYQMGEFGLLFTADLANNKVMIL